MRGPGAAHLGSGRAKPYVGLDFGKHANSGKDAPAMSGRTLQIIAYAVLAAALLASVFGALGPAAGLS